MESNYVQFESNLRPIIKGEISGKSAYFLLDTGTNVAFLDKTQLLEYNLELGESFPDAIVGIGSTTSAINYCKNTVTINGKLLNLFVLINMELIRDSIERETGLTILGVISYSQMKKLGIIINPIKNNINGI